MGWGLAVAGEEAGAHKQDPVQRQIRLGRLPRL